MNAFLATGRRDQLSLYFEHSEGWGREQVADGGQWPAWHPQRAAYAVSIVDRAAHSSRIELRSPRHELLGTPYRSDPGAPVVIGPRVPHYVSWAPSGRALSYVAATPAGLAAFLASLDAPGVARLTLTGAPIFSTWAPDGSAAFVHVGDRLVRVLTTTGEEELIASDALGFRVPAVSSDGRVLAFCRRGGAGVELCAGPAADTTFHPVATFPGGVVLAFRPQTHTIAVATTTDAGSGAFDALRLLPASGGDQRIIWRGPFVSFAWHPRGETLVLVVPTQMGDGRYALYNVDPGGGLLGATDGLLPSEETRAAFAFFDQYMQSHCAWSPDGRYFGLAGRCSGDGVSASLGDPHGPFALLWEPTASGQLRIAGPATFVSFPPAVVNAG